MKGNLGIFSIVCLDLLSVCLSNVGLTDLERKGNRKADCY
jgi:hypothetical protein